jgi:hypoxanthine phosphoribosyltransferase
MAERMRCELPTWDEVYELAREVAFRVHDDGLDPGLIVAIGRGGYTPARILADFLHKKELTSFRVQHYSAGATREARARVMGDLDQNLAGLSVLVVDDVNDSGDTLEAATGFVRERGATDVRTAVLQQKSSTHYEADYVARYVEDWRWIVYPWAVIEDVTEFLRRMDPRPRDPAEAAPRLAALYGIRLPARTLDDVFRLMPEDRRE